MKKDQIKWDKRYSSYAYSAHPSEIVSRYFVLAKKGRALDIAAGNGRNSIFLMNNGFAVDAVDISDVAIKLIREKDSKINPLRKDLDSYELKPNHYDLIININFLQRRLFPCIKDALKKDGILIFETFLDTSWLNKSEKKHRQDHYLKSNELLHSFLTLQIIHYQEKAVTLSNGELREAATLVGRNRL